MSARARPGWRLAQVVGSLVAAALIVVVTILVVGARLPAVEGYLPELHDQREDESERLDEQREEEAERLEEQREEEAERLEEQREG
jgi:hypothetical protein